MLNGNLFFHFCVSSFTNIYHSIDTCLGFLYTPVYVSSFFKHIERIKIVNIETVAVGTTSDLKRGAVVGAFIKLRLPNVDVLLSDTSSGIPDQPFGTEEMEVGARNRAQGAFEIHPDVDISIGIENGIVKINRQWFDPTCVVVLTASGRSSVAFGAYFPIPSWMVDKVEVEDTELGHVIQKLAGGGEKDPMKYLSGDGVPRQELLSQAVLCALAPILNLGRYTKP